MTESNDVGQHDVMDVDKVAQRDDVVTMGNGSYDPKNVVLAG